MSDYIGYSILQTKAGSCYVGCVSFTRFIHFNIPPEIEHSPSNPETFGQSTCSVRKQTDVISEVEIFIRLLFLPSWNIRHPHGFFAVLLILLPICISHESML